MTLSPDRNFDDLFDRFQSRIKNSAKGRLRETMIREDLQAFIPNFATSHLNILDAGCGLGDMSLWLAQQGHRLLATDISAKMVDTTRLRSFESRLNQNIEVRQQSLQDILGQDHRFDLICIHAVLEWMGDPYSMLQLIPNCLRAGGYLSLTIYNRHRSIFNSLVKGNFRIALAEDFGSNNPHSMTPPQPIDPDRVRTMLLNLGFKIEVQAGLRLFYDLLPEQFKESCNYEDVLLLERRYRHLSPFKDLARYIHFIARL